MSTHEQAILTNKYKNVLQSAGLIALLGILLWLVIRLLFGGSLLFYLLLVPALFILLNPGLSHRFILHVNGAVELNNWNAPALVRSFRSLVAEAKLDHVPRLYLIPSPVLNAFSFGSRQQAVVVITRGLADYLNYRELKGVLAHELSHIKHNDLLMLQLARGAVWFTSSLSITGLIILFFSLPLLLTGTINLSFIAVPLLLAAPSLSRWLWLALSRTREFQADLSAARLTGDPDGLATALYKIEYRPFSLFGRIFTRGQTPVPANSTHPDVKERIRRLQEYTPQHFDKKPEGIFHHFF